MEILINDSRTIREIQAEFNSEFPFLKLGFFDAPYEVARTLPRTKMISPEKKLGNFRKKYSEGTLVVTKDNTVKELENTLWKDFGISVQVFRKSGNLWIETSLTDSWTLERQNREGLELSTPHDIDPYQVAKEIDPTDRDKWE